jgi:hypothetical protein
MLYPGSEFDRDAPDRGEYRQAGASFWPLLSRTIKQASCSSTDHGGKRRSGDFAMREKIRMFVVASDCFKSGRIVSHEPAGIPGRRPHDVGD